MAALSVGCLVAAVVWAYLVLGHGRYWQTGERLPRTAGPPAGWPGVAAVIPARNEAVMLPATLPTLLAQDYPGALTVILVDDCSSDGTSEVAEKIGHQAEREGRELRVVAGAPPPPGWAGKVWAMAQGLRSAGEAGSGEAGSGEAGSGSAGSREAGSREAGSREAGTGPDYVLFTDADIAWD